MIQEILNTDRELKYFADDEEFYRVAKTQRSNCILDTKKLTSLGLAIRPVRDALREALINWSPT
jgi:hypothetical protein